MHAWIVGDGHVQSPGYRPSFYVGADDRESVIQVAARAVGLTLGAERTTDAGRTLVPTQHASVLGRCLAGVLGAPVGTKVGSNLSLPAWLPDAPREPQVQWARTCLSLRASPPKPGSPRRRLVESDRPIAWFDSLAALFGELVDDPESVRVAADELRLRESAVALPEVVPSLPDV